MAATDRDTAERDLDIRQVRAAATGDRDAFRQIYERKHRRVYLIAYQILGDTGMAEDVAQEAFVALWKHCGRYRARFALDTWLTRIATNRAIDRWRSERRHPRPPSPGARDGAAGADPTRKPGLAAPTWRADLYEIQAIWDDLATDLSPQQRAAFVLREFEGVDVQQVAAALNCGVSTVRSHISAARERLRAGLAERYPDYLPSMAEKAAK